MSGQEPPVIARADPPPTSIGVVIDTVYVHLCGLLPHVRPLLLEFKGAIMS